MAAPSTHPAHAWRRYVALGDSFTEGLDDPAPDGGFRGWADRLADRLAVATDGEFQYANLAVRGRLLGQVVEQQVPQAIDLGADLVSLVAGGNDVLRPGSDPDALAARLEDAVAGLRGVGIDVLLATPVDPVLSPLISLTRGKVAAFGLNLWSIARRHDAYLLDLWGLRALQDRRLWASDRIHLTGDGHARVAAYAAQVLAVSEDLGWAEPLPTEAPAARHERWRSDARWVRQHVGPWVGRRLRGRSSGDAVQAKRPQPQPVPGAAAPVSPAVPVPRSTGSAGP